jgi:hypothetical protein
MSAIKMQFSKQLFEIIKTFAEWGIFLIVTRIKFYKLQLMFIKADVEKPVK